MTDKIAKREDESVARPLKVLVPLIKEELEAGDEAARRAGTEHYQRAGEMLLEAKAQVEHGEWGDWLDRNFHLSRSTANDYMKLATVAEEHKTRRRVFSPPTLSSVARPGRTTHQPAWHEPVSEVVNRVNVEALARARQEEEKERKLLHQLGMQLIDIGYKVLAAQLHPDKKDGSADAMRRLNEVRRILKGAI